MVQTGPKRPRHEGGELWLTPDPLTPLENIQHKQRRRSTASKPKAKPSSLIESSKRASSGGRKSTKKPAKSTSREQTSSSSDESPSTQLTTASTLTPLGHLQLDDLGQNKLTTGATKKSSNISKQTSMVRSPESTSGDKEPHQTGASSSLTPSESRSASSDNELPQAGASSSLTPSDSQTCSKSTSKKHTSSQERKSANSKLQEASTSTSSTSDESPGQAAGSAVSGITPLEQLRAKKKRQSKRLSVPGRKSTRKSTMKLRSSGVRGVAWQSHMERTSLAVSLRESLPTSSSQGHTHPSHTPPASSTSTGIDSEGLQSDLSPLQNKELSSQIEKHHSPGEIGEDEMPTQTEEPEISPEIMEHDASPLANRFDPSPLTGGSEIFPLTEGASAPSSSIRHSTGSSTGPEHLKSVLKDVDHVSTLKRCTRRNSRVSFGRFVTVAEYSPNRHHSINGSRSLTMQNFTDENLPPMDRGAASLPDIQQGLGEKDEGRGSGLEELRGGESSDGIVESAESSSSSPPEELEPLGDEEEGEMGGSEPGDEGEEESMEEMETEEALEEVEQKR